jgi:hypothetical protein
MAKFSQVNIVGLAITTLSGLSLQAACHDLISAVA